MIPDRIKLLEQSYNSGHTIVIKDLENWNTKIKDKCNFFKVSTNVHLYLSPAAGTAFDWHTDDRDVFVFMQKGSKKFEVEEIDGTISNYLLTEGTSLFIPYGAKHKASPTGNSSVHLSFGVWPQSMTIKSQYEKFQIPLEIQL
jgi:mannose-6-phosphate isomerase-like protein (cupin superfamily)